MAFCLDKTVEAELRSIAGNNICVDCDGRAPQWASVSFGVFMCLECSGRHRALGVHISFVRSVSMDSWTAKQINIMRNGGNAKFIEFLQTYEIKKETPIANKYNLPAATLYKDRLLAQVEGRPLPSELPRQPLSASSSSSSLGATPAGTDPLPGESEEEYVARQRKLQAEAKERLRQKFGGAAGLSSNGGGVMQGIGSDPSYRPGGGGGTAGGVPDVTAQLAGVFSLVSSSVAVLGESVSKSIGASTEQQSSSGGVLAPETIDAYKQSVSASWSNLATGAVGLWSKSLEVVQAITKPPDDDDFKFPRGSYAVSQDNAAAAGTGSAGVTGNSSSGSGTSQKNSFFDQDFDTTAVTKNTESAKRPPYVPATVPAGISPTQSRDVMSGSSHSNSRSNLSSAGNSNNNLSAGGGSASKKLPTATAAAPAGDDFFKTFGV